MLKSRMHVALFPVGVVAGNAFPGAVVVAGTEIGTPMVLTISTWYTRSSGISRSISGRGTPATN